MATTCMVCNPRPISAAESVHEDMALVHACKRGDAEAFEELVKRYDRKLFRIAQHVTQNREDAQDVVQEAFLKVFRNLSQFREDSQFSTWLVRITINQSLMKVRKIHTKKEVCIDQDSQAETGQSALEFADWAPNPEERYRSSELRAILRKALNTLQPTLSLVFVLRDIEGLSTEQVSEVLDLSQAAVKTRLMRARLQLRERLGRYFRRGPRNLDSSSKTVSH
jgi:RNA polymerase sigma-70 factor, ECF subfamily